MPVRHWKGNGHTVHVPTYHADVMQNVDFSREAVRLRQVCESQKSPSKAMHWQRADLLSWNHVSDLLPLAPFDVILAMPLLPRPAGISRRRMTIFHNLVQLYRSFWPPGH
ncbi:hypothetical protein N7513_003455 [Penicillium frequentans]|uniref:Uncharacterized protein n=1 Tax=Penicillium frequentans TaxID=3151616 RepID=A0AAD6CYW4_9EURO|nr:hypothetical protein N7494_005161 [Penicillium glabrum]KAJ5557869.1 hypothetical protein N7513_003455 [Penicillium glabrum]